MRRYSDGFTLIELMVTVSLAAILLATAVPSFKSTIQSNRLSAQANEFMLAMTYAKSEAVKRNTQVVVCSRATDNSCSGDVNWDTGWLVFVDSDGDGVVSAGEEGGVLKVRSPLEAHNTLRAGTNSSIIFLNTGAFPAAVNTADVFNFCDDRGVSQGKKAKLSQPGWVQIEEGAAACP